MIGNHGYDDDDDFDEEDDDFDEQGVGAIHSLESFRLDAIQEFWIGEDPTRDSIRIIGSPAVLETHGKPCCLSGIRSDGDGDLFCLPLSLITACIVHIGDRNHAFYFPKGLLKGCRITEATE